jgi:hypothetical protein
LASGFALALMRFAHVLKVKADVVGLVIQDRAEQYSVL